VIGDRKKMSINLSFNESFADTYRNPAQIARILTEHWVSDNMYCVNCGHEKLSHFGNNRPVADFYCSSCQEEFELKSKNGRLGNKVVDGAYQTMLQRIHSANNPNFFFLSYDKENMAVKDFLIIPKHYFVSDIIEKRKPLKKTARRAGWVGCSILLKEIPETGRIFIVKDSQVIDKENVVSKWKSTEFLKEFDSNKRGWMIDVLRCIEAISEKEFRLERVYKFEDILQVKHPQNNFIRDKIRQQLQVLRDKGVIEFISRGMYRKL